MRPGRRIDPDPARERPWPEGMRRPLALGLTLLLLAIAGCRSTPIAPSRAAGHDATALADRDGYLGRATAARDRARREEKSDLTNCVDDYYQAAVFAYAALAAPEGPGDDCLATDLYNESLADCLRTARAYGRIDPRSRLMIHAPGGPIVVEVARYGFPWSAGDFQELVDSRCAPRKALDPHAREHRRHGLGSTQVVIRRNPRATPSDEYMPNQSFFPATAVLRPDLGAWLGAGGAGVGRDVLEFHDPLRVRCVEAAGRPRALAADVEAPNDLAEQAVDSRRYTLTGFVNPSREIENAGLAFLEPYQPGKVVVVFSHGLLDNPFTFKQIVNGLRACPGFVDRYQIAVFRYPTGIAFLRTAAILRAKLRGAEATFDPGRTDPGFQNMVLVGYSMGGLVTKLQIARSGDAIWSLFSDRPLDSLILSDASRAALRDYAYFEPLPFVRRVIFLATPHNGSGFATNIVGRVATSLVRRPEDSVVLAAQIERDNPGALKPFVADLPTSIDLMAVDNPLLDVMNRLPINPATPYHVIAGTAYVPPALARGDGVVPLSSARIDGSVSEHLVPAVHTNITQSPDTTGEIDRILRQHLDELAPAAPRRDPRLGRARPLAAVLAR